MSDEETPLVLTQFGRSLSNLFTQCTSPGGRVVVLSIDDITHGDGDLLLDTKRGGPVAMLKWAKGSKNGGSGSGHPAGRVSLADLRRTSAKLLRRKDSSSSKAKNLPLAETLAAAAEEEADRSCSPPPLVPPRGSSAMSSLHASSTTTLTTLTGGANCQQQGVIRQATVRRMPTLRHQAGSATPPPPADAAVTKRPGSSSSNASSCSLMRPSRADQDNSSSLYMQLDKIPVAVQQVPGSGKRKALEDISNHAYRQIIRSMQDELARMSDADDEPDIQPEETRTLAEATLLPINQVDIARASKSHSRQESMIDPEGVPPVDSDAGVKQQQQPDGMASFTNQPPCGDLHRPRAVRHQSPSPVDDCGLPPMNTCPPPFNCASSPLTKTCHTTTGQHVHQSGVVRSLANGLPVKSACSGQSKKNKVVKQVTFDTEARLIGDSTKLPVVFENEREDSTSLQQLPLDGSGEEPIPGFVNVPCNRRGFCLEDLISDLPEAMTSKLTDDNDDEAAGDDAGDEVDHAGRSAASPDAGYDWQPSYVNLEDTEIAPVLLATSRSAHDSSDFWRPRTVGQKDKQVKEAAVGIDDEQPVYDAPTNHGASTTGAQCKMDEIPLVSEFPGFRYAMHERRSISNGSSGSDTQDSGVAEMAQALSLSRAASASPQLAAGSRQSISEEVIVPTQSFIYNTLPRADTKRSPFFNAYWTQHEPVQAPQSQQTGNLYATTDPHFLSVLASPAGRQVNEEAPSSPSSSILMAGIDTNDASWSSDHLYCNMASVDPMPTLPPRISRRCHSLLALDGHRTQAGADSGGDYENLHPTQQRGDLATMQTPKMARRLNISHSRSRSLRHSGDFSSPFAWMIQSLNEQVKTELAKPDKIAEPRRDNSFKSLSARRQQLMYERAHRLELMLNDATANDYSDLYELSDWSMEAMLSDTVRDMDGLQSDSSPCSSCKHCCCSTVRVPPPPPQCRCQLVFISNHSPSSGCQCHRAKKRSPSSASVKLANKVRESVATQTDQQTSPLSRSSAAAENPLYMAYNDLTKIDEYEKVKSPAARALCNQPADDYASDGCETWNSHKALYARLKAAKSVEARNLSLSLSSSTPVKRSAKKQKSLLAPSSSRIWRHEGNNVSTPQKDRRVKRRVRDLKGQRSANATADSCKLLDRSNRSNKSMRAGTLKRRKSLHKPRASDVLYGKGQLQLAIYLNSGLLTIHVQSARYLRSRTGKACNSYVKISLIPDGSDETSCRTVLVKGDDDPWYDQKFSFEFLSADLYKRLFISVWNRDSKKNRSDFLGCMSFSVSHVIRKDASGWYRLLNANVGRQRHFAVKKNIDLNNSTIVPTDPDMEEDLVVVDDSDLDGTSRLQEKMVARSSSSRQSSVSNNAPPLLSGLLERPSGDVKGKTPYTITMRVNKGPRGFGFSVTWTHPPRIERVEPGMAAEQAGMRVGDYIVFVGNHNVVKMDEDQVLKHIQSSGDTLTLEVYRKSGKTSTGLSASDQTTMAELQKPPGTPLANPADGANPVPVEEHAGKKRDRVSEDGTDALHRARHGLINAETALSLAAHTAVQQLEHGNDTEESSDKGRVAFYLRKLEKMAEEHVDYMIMANQLMSRNIHTTPLMIASEMHKLKKLLDRIREHLPVVMASTVKYSSENEQLANQFGIISRHLQDVHGFLGTLNELLPKKADRIDYFLDAYKMSLDAFHRNVQEALTRTLAKRERIIIAEEPTVKSLDVEVTANITNAASGNRQQNIVYAASIRQAKLHSNVSDGNLIYQGFLWKREGSTETRYWALLFNDVMLLTHVNNGVHFVDEEPVALRSAVRILDDENRLEPAFRLMYRPEKSRSRTGRIGIPWGSCCVLALRANDWNQKTTWTDLIRRQIDSVQNREPGLKECDDTSDVGKRRKDSTGSGGTMGVLRRAYRCISSGAIPIAPVNEQSAATVPAEAADHAGRDDSSSSSSYYHSYSCDDLYLAADDNGGDPRGGDGQLHGHQHSAGPEVRWSVRSERHDEVCQSEVNAKESDQSITPVTAGRPDRDQDTIGQVRWATEIHETQHQTTSSEPADTRAAGGTGASFGVVAARAPLGPLVPSGTRSALGSVANAPPRRTADRIHRWTARLCSRCWALRGKRPAGPTIEYPTVTIRIEDTDEIAQSNACSHQIKTNAFQTALNPISEVENSSDFHAMRQFQSSVMTNTDERHVLHSTGDSTETSPSWASASSSAMETPNDVDQPLAFDFSRKCELNPDGRQQLVLPKNRVSYSMPTTPEMSEASPSPRQVTSGFFRFPFVGNVSPRRVRSRTMSAEGGTDEMGPTLNGPSSPPATSANNGTVGNSQHQTHAAQSADGKKLRFPRFLRRTHSASAAPEVPPYALFLRNKRLVSKTRSADLTVSTSSHGANDVFSNSVDESNAAAAACRKTRLSEMRLRLGFLRRRSTESSLSARPPPEEAQKWTESFMALVASKYGAALYRAFLLREFSNENLEFWLACEEYKHAKPQKLATKAQKIYNDFVAVQAPKEVNLDAETRLITLTNVQSNNPDPHAFDRAQRRIQHMMERDSYVRFLQSELFLELVHPERYSTPNATSTPSNSIE